MQAFQSLTVMLKVPDIRQAIDFYGAIGFALAATDEVHYGAGNINWAMMTNGGATIMLSIGGTGAAKTDQDIFLRVADADAHYAAIKDKVTVTQEPQDQFYGLRDFWFTDPFGFQWAAGHPLEEAGDGEGAG